MKNTCSLGKKLLCLLLCCVMLNCTAFAAGSERTQVGNVVITSNDPNVTIDRLSRADKYVFINATATCTSSKPFKISGNCRPENGKVLNIYIENKGDSDFYVKFSLTAIKETVTLNDLVIPEDPIYTQSAISNTDDGLSCSFSIEITPRRSNEVGNFEIYVAQTNK